MKLKSSSLCIYFVWSIILWIIFSTGCKDSKLNSTSDSTCIDLSNQVNNLDSLYYHDRISANDEIVSFGVDAIPEIISENYRYLSGMHRYRNYIFKLIGEPAREPLQVIIRDNILNKEHLNNEYTNWELHRAIDCLAALDQSSNESCQLYADIITDDNINIQFRIASSDALERMTPYCDEWFSSLSNELLDDYSAIDDEELIASLIFTLTPYITVEDIDIINKIISYYDDISLEDSNISIAVCYASYNIGINTDEAIRHILEIGTMDQYISRYAAIKAMLRINSIETNAAIKSLFQNSNDAGALFTLLEIENTGNYELIPEVLELIINNKDIGALYLVMNIIIVENINDHSIRQSLETLKESFRDPLFDPMLESIIEEAYYIISQDS